MKKWGLIYGLLWGMGLASCNNGGTTTTVADAKADSIAATQKFFPVTNFIRGQLLAITQKGVNPLRITLAGARADTSWIQVEEMQTAFAGFLQPVIDSTNLIRLFTETRFEDQTLGTYTFTYTPSRTLPDSIALRKWDVYINPETGLVKKIYLEKWVKGDPDNKYLQLTWNTDHNCKIVYLTENKAGKRQIEKEEQINWDF
jgi:hypothetical protein